MTGATNMNKLKKLNIGSCQLSWTYKDKLQFHPFEIKCSDMEVSFINQNLEAEIEMVIIREYL